MTLDDEIKKRILEFTKDVEPLVPGKITEAKGISFDGLENDPFRVVPIRPYYLLEFSPEGLIDPQWPLNKFHYYKKEETK